MLRGQVVGIGREFLLAVVLGVVSKPSATGVVVVLNSKLPGIMVDDAALVEPVRGYDDIRFLGHAREFTTLGGLVAWLHVRRSYGFWLFFDQFSKRGVCGVCGGTFSLTQI